MVAEPLNAEAPLSALAEGQTPTEHLFVRSHFPIPHLRRSAWRLKVSGEVLRPRVWSYAELAHLPSVSLVATIECAGNSRTAFKVPAEGELRWGDGAIGTALWEGVSLATLLREAKIRPGATEVVFTGADRGASGAPSNVRRFSRSLRVDLATQDEGILVATRMNGEPLTPEHGAPARLIVPGWYGMAWVKWLSHIAVQRTAFQGHFQTERYVYSTAKDGQRRVEPVTRMRVKSLAVSPAEGTRLVAGVPCIVAGKAWSGDGAVVAVEVDVGEGWTPARLLPPRDRFAWTSWEFPWTPLRKGPTDIRTRATDESGATQPALPLENEFQYGSNAVRPIRVEIV